MATTEAPKAALQFDRSTLGAVLSKIDPTLTTGTLDSLIKAAGSNESAAIKALFGQLNRLVLDGPTDVAEADLAAILSGIESAGVSGKLISLAGTDSAQLAGMANTDIGARYALIHGLPFALTGNAALYDNLNRDGSLFKFDPNTGEKLYTDEWLKDRAQFLAVKFNAGGASAVSVTGTQSWSFEERSDTGNSHIQVNADQNQRAAAKMVFATDTDDTQTIVGSASGDRIYSGTGDDNINTGAGDDYVEGGAGGDMIDGGRGNDTLLGGAGDDQLDGNVGDDKLLGGAGADYLVGGKGNDRLDGGNGFDTYVIDSGDGADVIVDADGQGEIVFDGQTLSGSVTFADDKYTDGRFTYTFAGDPEEGGVLVISSETGSMKLTNFKNGALGITLGDGSAGALLSGGDNTREILDLWGGNRFVDFVSEPNPRVIPIDITPPPPPVDQNSGGVRAPNVISEGEFANAEPKITATNYGANNTSAAPALSGEYADLFTDPTSQLPLITGEHLSAAVAQSAPRSAAVTTTDLDRRFGSALFLSPVTLFNDVGLNPTQIETALLDFHNAISLASALGGDNLGDAASLGVGVASIGASFDNKQLSDDKYLDLGSKKIGVKG